MHAGMQLPVRLALRLATPIFLSERFAFEAPIGDHRRGDDRRRRGARSGG